MRVADIVQRVRDTAGDKLVNQFTNLTLNDWINDGIRACALENSLLQKTAATNTEIGETAYNLPSDIFKLHSITIDSVKIPIKTLQEFEAMIDDDAIDSTLSGNPLLAYIWATTIYLYPKPSTELSMKIHYTSDPGNFNYTTPETTWLTQVPPIPVSYHSRIVTYCLAQVALQDDDDNKYQMFMEEFRTGVHSLKHQTESEEDLYPSIYVAARDSGNVDEYLDWGYYG